MSFDETFAEIIARLERIEARQADMAAAIGVKQTVTIHDLSRIIGCARATLYRTPWRLPNFGRSDFGDGVLRWWKATADAWYATPESDRRATWESMGPDERRKAMGRAA